MKFKEIVEKKTLDDIREIFYKATGLTISLCDIGETGAIDFYPRSIREYKGTDTFYLSFLGLPCFKHFNERL